MKMKSGAETVWIVYLADVDIDISIVAPHRLKNCLKVDFARCTHFGITAGCLGRNNYLHHHVDKSANLGSGPGFSVWLLQGDNRGRSKKLVCLAS